ncbi:hypothetical protein MXC99_01915 [Thauera aromatica]|uniref:hypothetical protein n=1 Tax=Thauera aromatica TaxID=59405 RepID=UPI001FFD7A11|nr:hypothetical protein [Thauera aromatica]MCK2086945.1 hypothetical protein [Thauera aromatica]
MRRVWSTYEYQPSFILGFHGCDKEVGEAILRGDEKHLKWSEKKYDWLGSGIYFWEGNPARAMEWAEHRKAEEKIATPFVIGAIIDLRHCLDLFDSAGLREVRDAHAELLKTLAKAGAAPPKNVGDTPDKAGRLLDCAVMNYLHEYRKERDEGNEDDAFDSIRAPFLEGEPVYAGAGFRSENHIQLCVRSTDCIKGYFRPITLT